MAYTKIKQRQLIRLTKKGATRACIGTTQKGHCPPRAPAATPSKAHLCLGTFDLWLALGNAAPAEVLCAAGTRRASPASLQLTGPRAAHLAPPYSQRLVRRPLGLRLGWRALLVAPPPNLGLYPAGAPPSGASRRVCVWRGVSRHLSHSALDQQFHLVVRGAQLAGEKGCVASASVDRKERVTDLQLLAECCQAADV
eukprot:scaffold65756_cov63-Phaeocystis_antarctica.AAC.3